ncbi:MAG: hypothetical protein LBI13_05130 [Streptococcaceae bacterium]|jgi:hypothetical protein|nr:hypothetical protein [Streptococcaceae bacterium]
MIAIVPIFLLILVIEYAPLTIGIFFMNRDYQREQTSWSMGELSFEMKQKMKKKIRNLRIFNIVFLILLFALFIKIITTGSPSFGTLLSFIPYPIPFFIYEKKYRKLYDRTRTAHDKVE